MSYDACLACHCGTEGATEDEGEAADGLIDEDGKAGGCVEVKAGEVVVQPTVVEAVRISVVVWVGGDGCISGAALIISIFGFGVGTVACGISFVTTTSTVFAGPSSSTIFVEMEISVTGGWVLAGAVTVSVWSFVYITVVAATA